MNSCATALVRRLALNGGWMRREALAEGLDWTEGRLDDELADLVLAEQVLFNSRGREYRLAGTPLCRQAARDLMRTPGTRRHVVGKQDKQLYRVGIAKLESQADGQDLLAVAELELPYSLDNVMTLEGWLRADPPANNPK